MKILVINCGSSSLKYQLVDVRRSEALAAGLVERIGEDESCLTHRAYPASCHEYRRVWEQRVPDHAAAMRMAVDLITDPERGVAERDNGIDAIGHRVVHGGETFTCPVLVDDAVVEGIRETVPLAPLHNPAALVGIETTRALFPDIPQVAVFDTAFHQTLPPEAYLYGVPYSWYKDKGVRRYGFHGTSHCCVVRRAARMLGKQPEDCNLITLHLGNGSSITAVKNGRSVDTSMGMTPLAGVMMGTRSGDLDSAIIPYMSKSAGLPLEQIEDILSRESGLVGLCGVSDLRDLHALIEKGDEQAALALRMLVYRYRFYVGAYSAVLGRVDALVFTAGIGENDREIRRLVCEDMTNLGVHIDVQANKDLKPGRGADVAEEQSPVRVLIVPTDEELEIARQTAGLIRKG